MAFRVRLQLLRKVCRHRRMCRRWCGLSVGRALMLRLHLILLWLSLVLLMIDRQLMLLLLLTHILGITTRRCRAARGRSHWVATSRHRRLLLLLILWRVSYDVDVAIGRYDGLGRHFVRLMVVVVVVVGDGCVLLCAVVMMWRWQWCRVDCGGCWRAWKARRVVYSNDMLGRWRLASRAAGTRHATTGRGRRRWRGRRWRDTTLLFGVDKVNSFVGNYSCSSGRLVAVAAAAAAVVGCERGRRVLIRLVRVCVATGAQTAPDRQ